jgi:hypothetical protein
MTMDFENMQREIGFMFGHGMNGRPQNIPRSNGATRRPRRSQPESKLTGLNLSYAAPQEGYSGPPLSPYDIEAEETIDLVHDTPAVLNDPYIADRSLIHDAGPSSPYGYDDCAHPGLSVLPMASNQS